MGFSDKTEDDEFYDWECVSIVRENGTTLDLVIKDYKAALCLIHFLHRHCLIEKGGAEVDPRFMLRYKMTKFQMKLQYEAYCRNIKTSTLIHYAVMKTM